MGSQIFSAVEGNKIHSQITLHEDNGLGFISIVNNVNDQGRTY